LRVAEFGAERNRAHVDPAQGIQPAGGHGGHTADARAMRRSQQDRANRAFAVQGHGFGDVVDDQIHRLVPGDQFENAIAVQFQGLGLARFPQRVAGPLMRGLQLHRLRAQGERLGPDPLAEEGGPSQGGDHQQRGSRQDGEHPVRRQPRRPAHDDDVRRRPQQKPECARRDQVVGLLRFHRADAGQAQARAGLHGLAPRRDREIALKIMSPDATARTCSRRQLQLVDERTLDLHN
jgi:hypothetical protein